MRRLITNTFLTLDGVMQAPGGPEEDADGAFALGGWSVNFWDDHMNQVMGETMGVPFDLVLGRRTYDIFAAHWPRVGDEEGGKPLNEAGKYVASRQRPTLDWQNSQLLDHDVPAAVAALKATDGPELQVHGSGDLLQTLMRHDLIDEYRLWVFPVVVGTGKRLFADGVVPGKLELVDSSVSTTGVVIGTYRPAGALTVGSFALE
ncbi:dihydrofolate reductase family protein [Mycobacterium sp. NPDC006124]|uniref:dihydrofolate reductase family protein n=1 Tax=Mycobacterium sp. NPDC006124 TaxID=3156729 RepID=UPI0033B841A4